MNYVKILEAAFTEKAASRKEVAERLGVSPAAVTNVLTRSDRNGINLNTFLNMLDVLGYEVVVQRKTQGRRKDGQYVLTKGDGEE